MTTLRACNSCGMVGSYASPRCPWCGLSGLNGPVPEAPTDKPGIESIPLSVAFQWNAVHRHGDDKYQNGRLGWRKEVVPLSDHINGIARHLKAISDGEMTDPDSGEKHAAHIMARAAIIIDALDHGVLKDDLNGEG